MIPITYCRSSSINNLNYCEHQWFITYCLGFEHKPNAKAEWGTCAHKVLELLALYKLAIQEGRKKVIDKEVNLTLTIDEEAFLKPKQLGIIEVDTINSSRINKDIYQPDALLKYGHIRYGEELVEYLIESVYGYYKKHTSNKWTPISYKHVQNWVWMALDYQGGIYDPRKKHIIAPEKHFEIEIKEDWAKYDYLYQGQNLSGYLKLKGTIDLTIDSGNDLYEIVDWKTGKRLNWATGEPKTYNKLQTDAQLLLYYYVAKQLYPDKDILVTIFFIRSGGPYTLCFTKEKIEESLELFKTSFDRMRNMKVPQLLDPNHEDFRCKRLCDFKKNELEGTNICHCIHHKINTLGIEKVIDLYSHKDHHMDNYQAPGSV